MRYFGAHVSSAGGLENAIYNGSELNVNTIQIHPSAPQRWITKDIEEEKIEKLVIAQKDSSIKKVFAHAIYLSNLAQPDKQKFHLAKMATVTYLNFMHSIEQLSKKHNSDIIPSGIVLHVGSAVHYPSKEEALERAAYGINWIMENSKGGHLILESAAGAGKVIGSKLEDLMWLIDQTEQKDRISIGLDTQHMFASGYDWRDPNTVVKQIKKIVPLDLISIFHLNDSKVEFGSNKDRHENLGEGEIGINAFEQIATHPELADIPLVLETPNMKSTETAKVDVEKLRKWIIS